MDFIEEFFMEERRRLNDLINEYSSSLDMDRNEDRINNLNEYLNVLEYQYRSYLVKKKQDRVDELEHQINMRDFGWNLTEEQIQNHIERSEHEVSVLKSEIDELKS